MKNKTVRFVPQKKAFKVTGFIFMWILALAVAAVFTQALRNSVSYIFFIIVCALPPVDLIYTLAASAFVTAGFGCSTERAGKNEPVEFSVTISNRFILPLPFTEAELMLPDVDGLKSSDIYVRVPLGALGRSEYKSSVAFPYKGEYSCGVGYVYVSGLFRFFRVKKAICKSGTVTVLPRRVSAPMPRRDVNDSAMTASAAVSGTDRAELTEIKEYVPGDPIRNIHWKLSTKVEELMTKHFGAENGLMTCVVADNCKRYELAAGVDADINEFCDDAICEICCYIISSALYDGKKAALIYNDTHKNVGRTEKKRFYGPADFDGFLPYFSSCAPAAPVSAASLADLCEEGADNDIIFVTSKLNAETVSALYGIQSADRAVTLVLFEPYAKLGNSADGQRKEAETYLRELAAADINIQRITEKELI